MRKNGKSLVQGQLSTMGKAMKAMKSPKLKGILKEQKQVGKSKSKAASLVQGQRAQESLGKGPKAKSKAVKIPKGMKTKCCIGTSQQ